MKKNINLLLTAVAFFFTTNVYALHGNPAFTGTIQYCTDSLLCNEFPAIEEGSNISALFSYNTIEPFPSLGDIYDYNIEIVGPSVTSYINAENSSIIFNDATISIDDFEFTEFTGGSIIIDSTNALSLELGISSQLRFDFNLNKMDFYVSTTLVASTSPVPVPAAAWLFGSGLIGLIGFARRRSAA